MTTNWMVREANKMADGNWANRLAMVDRDNDAIERAELGPCYACRNYRCETCTAPGAVYAGK